MSIDAIRQGFSGDNASFLPDLFFESFRIDALVGNFGKSILESNFAEPIESLVK